MHWLPPIALCSLLVLAFLLEPLVRREGAVTPSARTFPAGVFRRDADARIDRPSVLDEQRCPDGMRRCHSCGACVDDAFRYCEDCLTPTT